LVDYNTDDETDELLERQYSLNEKEGVLEASVDEVAGQVLGFTTSAIYFTQSQNWTSLMEWSGVTHEIYLTL